MALLDFLRQSPYGTAQGPNLLGSAGVPQGPTWGQILGAAARSGSRAGATAGLAPLAGGQQGMPGQQGLLPIMSQQQQKPNSTGTIAALLSIFGL